MVGEGFAQQVEAMSDLGEIGSAVPEDQPGSRRFTHVVAREAMDIDMAVEQLVCNLIQIQATARNGGDVHAVGRGDRFEPVDEIPL